MQEIKYLPGFDNELLQRFAEVEHILRFMRTFPETTMAFNGDDFVKPEELLKNQQDWISLYSNFSGIEKEFFKPYWVPFISGSYDFFFDLSNENLRVFEVPLYITELKKYIVYTIFDKATDLMNAAENGYSRSDFNDYRFDKLEEQYERIEKQRAKLNKGNNK